jgi:Sulfotransferase family
MINSKVSTKPRGPDFLVIGAQRAGTSWLHFTLKRHPALWLPPIKEIHHFDTELKGRWADPKQWRRAWGTRWRILDLWMFKFFLGDGSDNWYAKLFHQAQLNGRIAGEITPSYATVSERVFRRIRQMNRDVRIVFIMRDPVERAWSAVTRSVYKGKRSPDSLKVERALALSRHPNHVARSAYTETIRRLEAVFHASQLHFCFFDDLRAQPERFVAGILSFLGVDADEATRILLPPAISPSGARPIPFELQRELTKQHLPMIRELCNRFDGAPQQWLARSEKLLASKAPGTDESPPS